MIELREKALTFVKAHGPVLPVEINKSLGTNILFSSAILAELVEKQDVLITKAKIGGSPLYYTRGQEHKLARLRNYLGEMPGKIYDLLQEKKILRDKECEPWQRVALREIRDFAIPLKVILNSESELFWKWHLTKEEDAKPLIETILKADTELMQKVKEKETLENQVELPKEIIKEDIIEPEVQEVLEKVKEPVKEKIRKKREIKKEKTIERKDESSTFKEILLEYFLKNNIEVLKEEVIKRNSDYSFIVNIKSNLGDLKYYVKAKKKTKINEGDLTLAHHESTQKQLPVLFLSSGDLSKSAEKFLQTNLPGLVFRQI
ncbi:MAG: hypothetical protein PHG05_01605 [Candidatus Nanoarchaeia archaeon]|nr:hypothetical protein [Candidatus Nanoarchaeia archaeon]